MGDWVIVVPVKRVAQAKTRLLGIDAAARARLALAFAADTLQAASQCSAVQAVLVVTDDPDAGALATRLGLLAVPDQPDAGLNAALEHGAGVAVARWGDACVAALSSDLPSLQTDDLAKALDAASSHPAAFMADSAGSGTTLLTGRTLADFHPQFGPGSSLAHSAAGAFALDSVHAPSLRRDVDTAEDLLAAKALGLGSETAAALETLHPWPS